VPAATPHDRGSTLAQAASWPSGRTDLELRDQRSP